MSLTASGSLSRAEAAPVCLELIQKYNVRTNSCTCNTSFYSSYYILLETFQLPENACSSMTVLVRRKESTPYLSRLLLPH